MTIYAQYDKIVVLDLVVVFYVAYLDDRATTKNNVTIHVYIYIIHILITACLRKLKVTAFTFFIMNERSSKIEIVL